MIYIENTNDVQTIKVYSAVERGSYTNPDSPVNPNPEGGLTENEVEEIVDNKLENYYDKTEVDEIVSNISGGGSGEGGISEGKVEQIVDSKLDNYYDKTEVDEIVSNISGGGGGDTPTGGESGKIFTFRNDGHAYTDYVMEIVNRCIEGKLSTIKFGIEDNDKQGTATILNFSKIYRPDFDMIGEDGWQYYLTILYQNKEQTETKTYWYYVGDFSNGMTGTGIWDGTYDYIKLGYIIAPEIKPFGGGDGRVIKINSNYSIPVDDLNYAIDSIVNGKNVVFELPDGSKTSFYYETSKYDNFNEFDDWMSLTRKITIVDTKGLNSLDYAEYYHYEYFWYASGFYSNSSYDENGNVVIDCLYNDKLINIGSSKFVQINLDKTIKVDDLNYAIDTIINGGSVAFQFFNNDGCNPFYFNAKKYYDYDEGGNKIAFVREIVIIDTLGLDNLGESIYYKYRTKLLPSGEYVGTFYDENGNLVVSYYDNGSLIPNSTKTPSFDIVNVSSYGRIDNAGALNVSGATNVKSLTTNGAVNLKGGVLDEVNIDMRTNINRELKLNGGTSQFEDITFGIACDMKAQEIQITDLYNRNIIAGNNEESINFKDNDKNIIAKVDISGNLYEGETKLSDKYATKEDIATINNTLNQIKLALGIE